MSALEAPLDFHHHEADFARKPDELRRLIHEIPFALEQEVQLGHIIGKYVSWGEKEEIKNPSTGFSARHAFSYNVDIRSPEVQQFHVDVAVKLVESALEKNGWDSIDRLVVASGTSWENIAENVSSELQKRNITVHNELYVNEACNSVIDSVLEVTKEAKDKNQTLKTVIVTVDSNSGNLIQPGDVVTSNLFGNGGTLLAFEAGKDIEHIDHLTVIHPDTEGVICVPDNSAPGNSRKLEETDLEPKPRHIHYPTEQAEKTYVRTKKKRVLRFPRSVDDFVHVNGEATGMLFSNEPVKYIVRGFARYAKKFRKIYGELGEPWMHQPSLPVIKKLQQKIVKYSLMALGLEEKTANRLCRKNKEDRMQEINELPRGLRRRIRKKLIDVALPWVMENTDMNNISPGTPVIQFVEMVKMGRIVAGKAYPLIGLGIGAEFSIGFVFIRKRN